MTVHPHQVSPLAVAKPFILKFVEAIEWCERVFPLRQAFGATGKQADRIVRTFHLLLGGVLGKEGGRRIGKRGDPAPQSGDRAAGVRVGRVHHELANSVARVQPPSRGITSTILSPLIHRLGTGAAEKFFGPLGVALIGNAPIRKGMVRWQEGLYPWVEGPLTVIGNTILRGGRRTADPVVVILNIIRRIQRGPKADHAEVAETPGLRGFFLRFAQRREKHSRENSNDGDHHQKFDQGKSSPW